MEKHCTATVFVVTEEHPRRILLLFHKKLQVWNPPGGHIEPNENPLEAAIRETREETGLDVSSHLPLLERMDGHASRIPLPFTILEESIPAHGDKPEHYHIDHIYVATMPFQEANHNPHESDGLRWVAEVEMDQYIMFENCRMLMKEIYRKNTT